MKLMPRSQTALAFGLAIGFAFVLTKLDFANPRVGDDSFSRGFFRQVWRPDHVALCLSAAVYACVQCRRIPYLFLLLFFVSGIGGYGLVFTIHSGLPNQALILMLRGLVHFGVPIALGAFGLQFLVKLRARTSLVYLLGVFAGVCKGMQHAVEMPVYLNRPVYGFGVMASTLFLLLIGVGGYGLLSRLKHKRWELLALRGLGCGLMGVAILAAAAEASR